MHVLFIAAGDFFSTYGGGQVYVRNVVDEMLRQGSARVSVLSFNGTKGLEEKVYHDTCTIYQTGDMSDGEMMALVTRLKPDLVHAHSHKAQACRVGRTAGVPVVVTAHHGGIVCPAGTLLDCEDRICSSTVSHEHCLKCVMRPMRGGLAAFRLLRHLPANVYVGIGRGLKRLPFIYFVSPLGGAALSVKEKKDEWDCVARASSLVLAPSLAIKESMLRNGLENNKVVVLPHGIPLPSASCAMPKVREGVRFFYVGRISYVKGLHVMLEAFHRLDNPNAAMHLIGGSGNKQEQRYEEKLKQRYRDDQRVVWHGKVRPEDVFSVIKDFHVLVAPSVYLEVFGLNIAEALSLGRPVLASRCGGAEMQIKDGVNGWLVTPNDVDSMADAMEKIAAFSDAELHSMAVHCHALPIERHCKQLMQIYSELTN